jgi:hypothetical protein
MLFHGLNERRVLNQLRPLIPDLFWQGRMCTDDCGKSPKPEATLQTIVFVQGTSEAQHQEAIADPIINLKNLFTVFCGAQWPVGEFFIQP